MSLVPEIIFVVIAFSTLLMLCTPVFIYKDHSQGAMRLKERQRDGRLHRLQFIGDTY
jgi:hypothetical protein